MAKTEIDILVNDPSLQQEVQAILGTNAEQRAAWMEKNGKKTLPSPAAVKQIGDKNPVIPYESWKWAEIIARKLDTDDMILYHVETLNISASTAGTVALFDTTQKASGIDVTNLDKASEMGDEEVFYIEKIGLYYLSDSASKAEIDRLEYEGFLHIGFEGNRIYKENIGELGGLGGAEIQVQTTGANAGAAATPDTCNYSKGEPKKLQNMIKLPSGQKFEIELHVEASVATALAGDLLVALYGTRGKKKRTGFN